MALHLLLVALLAFFLTATPTHAYIDPGTGSYFFQMLIGLIFGGLVAVKIFFRQIKAFVTNLLSKRRNPKP